MAVTLVRAGKRFEVQDAEDLFAVLLFVERLGFPVKWEWA